MQSNHRTGSAAETRALVLKTLWELGHDEQQLDLGIEYFTISNVAARANTTNFTVWAHIYVLMQMKLVEMKKAREIKLSGKTLYFKALRKGL